MEPPWDQALYNQSYLVFAKKQRMFLVPNEKARQQTHLCNAVFSTNLKTPHFQKRGKLGRCWRPFLFFWGAAAALGTIRNAGKAQLGERVFIYVCNVICNVICNVWNVCSVCTACMQ